MVEQEQAGVQTPGRRAVTPLKGSLEQGGPLRQCALTRIKRPTDELIRFVRGPGNQIYPDLSCRLPGRGVWISADRASIKKAISTGVFGRSLKSKIEVEEDLPEKIDNLLVKRVIESLSLANKAGLVVAGYDSVFSLIGQSKAVVLLHGEGAADSGRDRLDRKFVATRTTTSGSPLIFDGLTIEQMSLAIGRSNVVHAALKAGGATDRFEKEAQRMLRYHSGTERLKTPNTTAAN